MKINTTLIERLAGYAAVVAIVACFIVLSFIGYAQKAHANPSFFDRSNGTNYLLTTGTTNPATTSPQYMTPGVATTTESWDTGHNIKSTKAMNSAVLQLAIKASTTAPTFFGTTTIAIRIEQSDNGIDWTFATSSLYATNNCEQIGGASACTASTSVAMRTIPVPVPLRFIRAIVGVNPGSANNAAVWMQFVGQSENN